MKTLVIGASGQLGTALIRELTNRGMNHVPAGHEEVEIIDTGSVDRLLKRTTPDWVVTTAAKHKVVECEEDRAAARAVNVDGTANVLRAARQHDARVMFVSTDYVFGGRDLLQGGARSRPYEEDHPVDPVNYYGVTKAEAEKLVIADPANIVVRVAGLFGRATSRGKGGNFVSRILELARDRDELQVVSDQIFSPTRAEDAARVMVDLLGAQSAAGIYHVSNVGEASWYDLARVAVEAAGEKTRVLPTRAADYFHDGVQRPSYSAFGHDRLAALGVAEPPHWEAAAREHVAGFALAMRP
jgi:dTDP-4-dehydrorhamnose reductase